MKLKSRIKELRHVRAGDLIVDDRNFRIHGDEQRTALNAVLEEVGMAGALIARETKDGLVLIDGHMRAETDLDSEWPVLITDLTADEAAKLLVSYDSVGEMAEVDEKKLASLVGEIDDCHEEFAKMLADYAKTHGMSNDEVEITLKDIWVKPPPKMTWALIGVPTVQYGAISEVIESISEMEDSIVETSSN